MNTFNWAQFIKDLLAIPIFILIANTPNITTNRVILSLLFAFGCLTDTVYCCVGLYYPLTWARIKDVLGMSGMWVFSLVLIFAPDVDDPGRWPMFFWFASAVDLLSILSIIHTNTNIYVLRRFII